MQELKNHDEALQARVQSLAHLPNEAKAAQRQLIARERLQYRKPKPAQHLDRQCTDWHWLYRQIKREWKNLKGLQNRERIWCFLAYIVDGSAENREALDKLYARFNATDN